MNLSATLLLAGPLTVIFLCVTVIKQQQVRRCRRSWITRVLLVTGAGHGTRRHRVRAEKLLRSQEAADKFGSQFINWESRSIWTCPDMQPSPSGVSLFEWWQDNRFDFCSAHIKEERQAKKLVYQYLLHNFKPDWLLFKLDYFPLYNNRNSELQKNSTVDTDASPN